jgi:two-component system cell cycle response regulator
MTVQNKYATVETPSKILVVEDNAELNRLMQKTLQREGFETAGVFTGSETVKWLANNNNAIIILDYLLPDMNGTELVQLITKKRDDLPFVVITGHGDEKIAVEMMKKGAKDYIVKGPDFIDMLPHVIHRVINDLKLEKELALAEQSLREREADLSILYEISRAVSQTIDMQELQNIILKTVTGLEMFHIEKKGGLFMIEDDRMDLVSYLNHDKSFLNLHKSIRVGDCLCGLAAKTGKVIVSKNCDDKRHTITYSGMKPHGHIIIPLIARGSVIGVLYLYLPANFHIDENKLKLFDSIGVQIGIALENAKLYEETKRVSLYDPLTGLANRRMMDIMLEKNFARSLRLEKPLSVIMLDIDYFKDYNDRLGHNAGDSLLVSLAAILLKETRKIDLVVRYGGEEFLVLLPDTEISKTIEVAERMRKKVEDSHGLTISLGVATYNQDMKKEEDLVIQADQALYQAKRKGRNRVEVHN